MEALLRRVRGRFSVALQAALANRVLAAAACVLQESVDTVLGGDAGAGACGPL